MPTKRKTALTTPDGRPMNRANRLGMSIKAGQAIGYLNRVVEGTEIPDGDRIRAAKILLDKVIPNAVPDQQNLNEIKDISGRDPHYLLRVIEGKAERINPDD